MITQKLNALKTSHFIKVALRNSALFVETPNPARGELSRETIDLLGFLLKNGFSLSEEALRAVNGNVHIISNLQEVIAEVLHLKNNWAPLVKGWEVPTGETFADHFITFLANELGLQDGTRLPCGHIIPEGTFRLERYNGCPFCGMPFEFAKLEHQSQGSQHKILELWTTEDLENYFEALLVSKTALDATQLDSLKLLLPFFEIKPKYKIEMRETSMLVTEELVRRNESERCLDYLKTPNDILRFLWYKHTGFLQILPPKIIVERKMRNMTHIFSSADQSQETQIISKKDLKLKYTRKECRMVARWINNLPLSSKAICENMHPKRQMWVRFIRALRLAEYAHKQGFENLKEILDVFYNEDYEVVAGKLQEAKLRHSADDSFAVLKNKPGLFARSLFANILWFGADTTIAEFKEIADKVPMRLLLTLNMYSDIYFDKTGSRIVKPLLGNNKVIATNKLLKNFSDEELSEIKTKVEELCLWALSRRFAKQKNSSKTVFIDSQLYNIPLPIGDRTANIQDFCAVSMGKKFKIEETELRLFMQWGEGLPAQHLDMDLSCHIAYEDEVKMCSYFNLRTLGAKHSGDIRSIPEKIGTAEYINLNIRELQNAGAKYVTFTCNAYSTGDITPNLAVGWMNSRNPMKISSKTGVAYDPSCVIHQIRVSQSAQKGLVFGVLDVCHSVIIWLEMPFLGQHIGNLSIKNVETLLKKLEAKTTIGRLLKLRADVQNLNITTREEAEEVFDLKWASKLENLNEMFAN